jgi:protein ImuA
VPAPLFPSDPVSTAPRAVAALELLPPGLHAALWRAHQLGRGGDAAWPSGFDALDAQLPGWGWPCGVLTELLLTRPGLGEMRLLAPALAGAPGPGGAVEEGARADDGSVMLFDPPAVPCAQALAQLGVDARRIVVVHGREGSRGAVLRHLLPSADLLWALEQALRSAQVGAVLAWLPDRLAADALRRLQLAAQAHAGPAFLLRGIAARQKPSPAPLRLALHASPVPDELIVHLLKRRGPPLAQPLRLLLPPVLSTTARARVLERLVASGPGPAAVPLSQEQAQGQGQGHGPASGHERAVRQVTARPDRLTPAAGGGLVFAPAAGPARRQGSGRPGLQIG